MEVKEQTSKKVSGMTSRFTGDVLKLISLSLSMHAMHLLKCACSWRPLEGEGECHISNCVSPQKLSSNSWLLTHIL